MKKILFLMLLILNVNSGIAEIFHTTVSERSDSSGLAKEIAMKNANREVVEYIFTSKLGTEQTAIIMPNISDDEIQSMIKSVSIENEKTSDTLYEADLYINTFDDAVNKYISKNNLDAFIKSPVSIIPNFENQYFVFDITNGLREWARIRQIIKKLEDVQNIKLNTEAISGNMAKISCENKDVNYIKQTLFVNGFNVFETGNFYKVRL